MNKLAKLIGSMLATMMIVVPVSIAPAQEPPATTRSVGDDAFPAAPLPYGSAGLPIPEPFRKNGTRPRTVQLLGEAIGRLQGPQRVQVIRDIGACEMSEGIKYLEIHAGDPDPCVRAEIARSIGIIGDKQALPIVQKLFTDESMIVRREALIAGAILGDASFATEGLKSDNAQLLIVAMEHASTSEHADAIAALLPKLSTQLQIHAMTALGRLGATNHAAAVASFAGQAVPLAAASMRSLGEMKATDQVDVVLKTLGEAHPTVRRDATAALAGVASAVVQQQNAIHMLSDPDPTVRETAAILLQSVPLAAGVAPLVEQLDDGYAPLHQEAREALVAARTDAIPAAAQLLNHDDPRRREDGSYVLGQLASAEALDRHIALLQDSDWDVVAQVARSLGNIQRQEASPAIAKLVERAPTIHAQTMGQTPEQRRINVSATRAMADAVVTAGRLNIKSILPPLIPLMPQRDAQPFQLRAAIIWAFGVMGEPSQAQACEMFLPIYGDLFEATIVKFEALKALGNFGYKPATDSLKLISTTDFSPTLRWIAYWSHRQITGEPTQYANPVMEWSADVSIADMPKL